MNKELETIKEVLYRYLDWHDDDIVEGTDTAEVKALAQIEKIIKERVIGKTGGYLAMDDLHGDAYEAQNRLKSSQRVALTNALYGDKK